MESTSDFSQSDNHLFSINSIEARWISCQQFIKASYNSINSIIKNHNVSVSECDTGIIGIHTVGRVHSRIPHKSFTRMKDDNRSKIERALWDPNFTLLWDNQR